MDEHYKNIPSGRLIVGGAVLVIGFLSPLLIPLVISMNINPGLKTAISGILMIGFPELAMLLSVIIMGKAGFAYLKVKFGQLFLQYGPPDTVSQTRYHVGLIMFIVPITIGWLLPYFEDLISWYPRHHLWISLGGDALFITSLFILGGDFWEKLKNLFVYNQKVAS